MGLRLSPEKTLITHIDDGLDFLGWRIQRHRKRGTDKSYVYVYPAKKALAAIMAKVKALCRQNTNLPLGVLLIHLNRMLRGWTAYFKYGCSNATFSYLRSYLWKQVIRWQERKHRRTPWKELRRRYGIWPAHGAAELFDPARVSARRYYYRGTKIATPWPSTARGEHQCPRSLWSARCAERRTPGAGGDPGKPTDGNIGRAPRVDLTLASELADWRADYVGRVVPGACSRPAPPCRALPVTAGCGAQGKAQGPPSHPGSQVRGRPDA